MFDEEFVYQGSQTGINNSWNTLRKGRSMLFKFCTDSASKSHS